MFMNTVVHDKKLANRLSWFIVLASITLMLVYTFAPTLAFAEETTGDSSLLGQVGTFFTNSNSLIVAVYEGLVLIVGAVVLLSVGKDLVPAAIDSNKRQSPEFKQHVQDAVIAVVVVLAFALAPIFIPAIVDFFAPSNKISFSN